MDASSTENTAMITEADASCVDDSVTTSENGAETDSGQHASGGTDFHLNTTQDEHAENEFKSPTNIPLSVLTTSPSCSTTTSTSKKKPDFSEVQHENAELQNINSEELTNKSYIPYQEPEWSGKADEEYYFDVLKNGSIIDTVSLKTQPFYVFGRLPSCDVTLEHPSLSRYHAVLQYNCASTPSREKGWYIYDLDSTHGTWVNKKKISPKVYHRLRVGHIVKFGGSSRLHILQLEYKLALSVGYLGNVWMLLPHVLTGDWATAQREVLVPILIPAYHLAIKGNLAGICEVDNSTLC